MTDCSLPDGSADRCLRWMLAVSWWLLAASMLSGTALELMHAWKLPLLLDGEAGMRRTMWRLAHAHAAALACLDVLAVGGLALLRGIPPARTRSVCGCLLLASVLIPLGYLLAGLPRTLAAGRGLALVPAGGVALLAAVLLMATAPARVSARSSPALPRTDKRQ